MPHKQSLKQTISVFVALNLILSQILYAAPVGKTTIGIDKQDKLLHNYETDDKSIISDQENNPNLTIDKTNNGVPLININKPNSKGTSHNIYKAYSVTNKGVILNNSNKITNTALAGQVMPNTNYSKNTKEASLIINEISGSDISKLQGITEIAGSKADIIISNPNGIYINGAGFINANNVRLTTNAPLEKQANKGKIEIDGLGLDLSNTNKSELIASVAKLNAPIYNANELEITLGSKENKGNANSNNNAGIKQYSLDASALGSIHANKIKIVSNNKGVGVKSNSQIIANTDDLIINSQGNIELKDAVANKDIKLKAKDSIKLNDTIVANNDIKLKAKKSIEINNIVSANNDINIKTNTLNNKANIVSNNNIDISVENLNNNSNLPSNSNNNNANLNSINSQTANSNQSNLSNPDNRAKIYAKENLNLNIPNYTHKEGELLSDGSLNINSQTLEFQKDLVSNSNLNINANSFINSANIITDSFNIKTNEFTNNSILASNKNSIINSANLINSANSLIYSNSLLWFSGLNDEVDNNILNKGEIYSNDIYAKANSFINEAGNLIADNDIFINVNEFKNIGVLSGTHTKKWVNGGNSYIQLSMLDDDYLKNIANKIRLPKGEWVEKYNIRKAIYISKSEYPTSHYTSDKSLISAGNNFTLISDYALNQEADIIVGNDFNIQSNEFYNQKQAVKVPLNVEFARNYKYEEWRSKKCGKPCGKRTKTATAKYRTTYDTILYSDKTTNIIVGNNINANVNIFGNGDLGTHQGNNYAISSIITNTQSSKDYIANKGLFNLNSNPNSPYLYSINLGIANLMDKKEVSSPINPKIETDPRYTDLSMFLSSNYLFDRLNFNPDKKIKLLGDSAYETRLLRDAIIEKTGKRYLLADNDYEQRKALFDNALDEAKSLNLSLGVALSKEQIQNLSKDIIWYEKEIVANQEVLVPKLYLSKQTLSNLANTNPNPQLNLASINSGANININANEFINTANINSGNDINIISNSFINQTIFTNDKANINANNNIFINSYGDISNLGADIVAKNNLILNSLGDITNQTNLNYYTNDYKHTYSTTTGGNLNAKNILINANNFTNISANINADENLQISAKNDIKSDYLHDTTTTYQGNASSYTKTENKKAILGDIKANNINLISNNDINLAGISLKAKQNLNILAGNDINIIAAKNSSYKEQGSSKSGFFSSKEEITINQSNTHTNSNLNASNINLASNSDINLFGVDLNSNDEINLRAGGDITQASVKDTNYYYHRVTKSSLFGLNKSLHEKEAYNEKALISQALANDGSLTYNAKNNLLLSGVKTYSNKDTNLNADNVFITSLELNSFENEVNKKSRFNPLGLLASTGLTNTPIYEATLNKTNTIKTTNQASTISSNANLNINSNNDITIKGSNLNSDKSINLSSDNGEVNILASKDSTSISTLDKKTSISLINPKDNIKQLIKDAKAQETKAKAALAKANYHKDETNTNISNINSSNLNANESINVNSHTDTTISGSNLNANENINITSQTGNINITSDINTINEAIKAKDYEAIISATAQNEYAEIGSAAKDLLEATKQLNKVKKEYDKYKSELSNLQSTLSNLKQRYKNKEAGIDYSDIEDLTEIIDNLKDEEKYYKANIALATENVAAKTAALASQAAAAASSSGTYGFSVGLSADLKGSKFNSNSNTITNKASNLKANNINLTNKKDTTITGSNLIANNDININTNNLNINASQDTYNYNDKSKELSGSIDYTIYGGGGGTLGLNYSQSHSDQENLINNNSQIIANNDININTTNDTTIKGANLRADNQLNLNTNNLTLESLRDKYQANSKSSSIGVGLSFSGSTNKNHIANGNLKTSSVNANYGTSSSNSIIKQTNLSSITANEVNINAKGNTHLKGSMIASGDYDNDGKFIDNGNLNLKTNTLTYENLANTSYNKGSNFNISANLALKTYDKDNIKTNEPTLQGGGSPENKITSANYANSRSQGYSSSKTLATIGQGNLQISDTTNSDDLDRLNRNTDEINKDLYNTQISSNIQASIDTRLFTEQGRKDIKDDINKATAITNALSTIIQTGELNFNQEVGQNYNTYQTNKALGENLINILENDNLSIAEKENFLAQFTKDLAKSNGYDLENLQIKFINDTDAIGADNQNFKGNYNSKTNTITLNLANISNLSDFTDTLGHEFTHAITDSKNKFIPQDTGQNNYADLKGSLFTNYLNKALDIQGNSIDLSNSNVNLNYSNPNNINALENNLKDFNSQDMSQSDNNIKNLHRALILLASAGKSIKNAVTKGSKNAKNSTKNEVPENPLNKANDAQKVDKGTKVADNKINSEQVANKMKDKSFEEAEKIADKELLGNGWQKAPLKKGDGIRYYDGKGNSLQINKGYDKAQDNIHGKPYIKYTKDGQKIRESLLGNE